MSRTIHLEHQSLPQIALRSYEKHDLKSSEVCFGGAIKSSRCHISCLSIRLPAQVCLEHSIFIRLSYWHQAGSKESLSFLEEYFYDHWIWSHICNWIGYGATHTGNTWSSCLVQCVSYSFSCKSVNVFWEAGPRLVCFLLNWYAFKTASVLEVV